MFTYSIIKVTILHSMKVYKYFYYMLVNVYYLYLYFFYYFKKLINILIIIYYNKISYKYLQFLLSFLFHHSLNQTKQ